MREVGCREELMGGAWMQYFLQTQHMLEELDKTRKEEFKAQEMWKEHRRRQRLTEMNEQQRLLAEEEYKKKQEEMRHHEKLPQPGSKEQIEQVWKEEDGMPEEQFDPRTFFHMHGEEGGREERKGEGGGERMNIVLFQILMVIRL